LISVIRLLLSLPLVQTTCYDSVLCVVCVEISRRNDTMREKCGQVCGPGTTINYQKPVFDRYVMRRLRVK